MVAVQSTYIYNYGGLKGKGFKPRTPDQLFPELFGKKRANFEERWERANKQEAEYLALLEQKKFREN